MASGVLCKGRGPDDAVHQAIRSIHRSGHRGKLLLTTDGEPALVDLRKAVEAGLGLQAIPEHTPARDPQSNGAIENGVKLCKGMLRTLYLALEERLQGSI